MDWGIPDRSIGNSFPSTSILGVGLGTSLDFALSLSSGEGGAGADKLVIDAGSIDGGGEECDWELSVVPFDEKSFAFEDIEGIDSKSDNIFVEEVVVDSFNFVGGVAGVDEMTLVKGGALKSRSQNQTYQIIFNILYKT